MELHSRASPEKKRKGNRREDATWTRDAIDRWQAACPRYESVYVCALGYLTLITAIFICRRYHVATTMWVVRIVVAAAFIASADARRAARLFIGSRAYVICRGGRYWIRRLFLANCLVFFSVKFTRLDRVRRCEASRYLRDIPDLDSVSSNHQSYVITSPR